MVYGHVMRREEEHAVKRVMTKEIPGKRTRGRPKTRWEDVCRRDVGLRAGEEGDRAYWINNHTQTKMTGGKDRDEEVDCRKSMQA